MAQKLFVNQTGYTINGDLTVRAGSTPGKDRGVVSFSVDPNGKTMVPYGDENDPYVDQLEVSALTNGAVILSNQIVITRGSQLDNDFNMNDTIYINLQGQSFVLTFGNTWTV